MAAFRERTIILTYLADRSTDETHTLATLEGVTLPLDGPAMLVLDGVRRDVVRRHVEVSTSARTVTTTLTVL